MLSPLQTSILYLINLLLCRPQTFHNSLNFVTSYSSLFYFLPQILPKLNRFRAFTKFLQTIIFALFLIVLIFIQKIIQFDRLAQIFVVHNCNHVRGFSLFPEEIVYD